MRARVTVQLFVIVALVGVLAGCGATSGTSTGERAASSAPATTADDGWGSSAAPSVDLDAVGSSAQRAVQAYYEALDAQDFQSAWSRLSGAVRSQFGGYDAWAKGYATSLSQKLTSISAGATDASHATVMIVARSRDRDACGQRVAQRWSGTWTLARPAGRWIARAVSISRTAGETPITDASACPSSDTTTQASAPSSSADTTEVCYPGITLPAVTLPATRIPAVTIPATTIGGVHYPAQHIPGQRIPAQRIPAQHIGGGCFEAPSAFALNQTTELDDSVYPSLDSAYSASLTHSYRSGAGSGYSYPDPTAPGFGELNGAGYPKNQYVRPYVRRDGTVSGYWRNSPSDGLPTCHVISC